MEASAVIALEILGDLSMFIAWRGTARLDLSRMVELESLLGNGLGELVDVGLTAMTI